MTNSFSVSKNILTDEKWKKKIFNLFDIQFVTDRMVLLTGILK